MKKTAAKKRILIVSSIGLALVTGSLFYKDFGEEIPTLESDENLINSNLHQSKTDNRTGIRIVNKDSEKSTLSDFISTEDQKERYLLLMSMNRKELLQAGEFLKKSDIQPGFKKVLLRRLYNQLSSLMPFDEVYSLIKSEYDYGDYRAFAINGLITGTSLSPREIGNKINEAPSSDRKSLLDGLFSKINLCEVDISPSNLNEIRLQGNDIYLTFLSGLANKLYAHENDRLEIKSKINAYISQIPKHDPKRNQFLATLLSPVSSKIPREAIELYLEHGQIGLMDNFSVELIGTAILNDPAYAKEILWGESSVSSSLKVRTEFVSSLMKLDQNEADNWFNETIKKVDGQKRDQLIEAWITENSRQGNYSEGVDTLKLVSDLGLKKKLNGRIWESEKKDVLKKSNADPEGTISAIVSGESLHADYWLEASVSNWLKKDSHAVNEWYEDNWKSLAPEKLQYVAAAFANEAVAIGDLATASEWVEQIQHPKTRERILSLISKAQNK